MTVRVDCGKVAPHTGCGHVIEAENEQELMKLAAEHARDDHGMEPTPELQEKVRANIERM
jgi:predicted small metal-binding protein